MVGIIYHCWECKIDGKVFFHKSQEEDGVDVRFCPQCGHETFCDGLYDIEEEDYTPEIIAFLDGSKWD